MKRASHHRARPVHPDTAPPPAAADDRAPAAVSGIAHGVIVETCAIGGPRGTGISHYRLELAVNVEPWAPRRSYLTRNLALFNDAVTLENARQRVALAWHQSRRPDGSYCRVVDSVTEAPEP
jgi:hypothetical protein